MRSYGVPNEPSSTPEPLVVERFLAWPPWRHALALVLLAGVLTLRFGEGVLDPNPRPDEQVYVDAADEVLAGGSPYAVADFLYPPPFAYAVAVGIRASGVGTVLVVSRVANVAGAAALLWLAFGCLDLSWRQRLVGAAILGCLAPGMAVTMLWGNITPAIGVMLIAGLLLWSTRPVASGLLLGLSGVAKPLAPVALVTLGAHRPLSRCRPPDPYRHLGPHRQPDPAGPQGAVEPASAADRTSSPEWWDWLRASHRLAAVIGLAAGASIALATPHLRAYLATSAGRPDQPRNLSLHRLLDSLGLGLDSLTVVALAAVVAVAWVRWKPLSRFELLAVGTATTLLAVPLVWSHTLLLTLPLQGLALQAARERLAGNWGRHGGSRSAGSGRGGRKRIDWGSLRRSSAGRLRLYEAIAVALACSSLIASDGADGPAPDNLWLRTLFVGLAAAAPSVLAAYVVWTGSVARPTSAFRPSLTRAES